jgi:hypothetical protein
MQIRKDRMAAIHKTLPTSLVKLLITVKAVARRCGCDYKQLNTFL